MSSRIVELSDPQTDAFRNKLVFQEARELLSVHSASENQKILLMRFLVGLEVKARDSCLSFISLPLIVYASIAGKENAAIRIAVASLFLFLAADIADDVADGDFAKHWGDDVSSSEGILASGLFASALAPLALNDASIQNQCSCLIKTTLSKCILSMAAGQQGDLQSSGSLHSTSPEQVIENVQGKSGEEIAGFFLMAAQFAGADECLASEYYSIGRLVGTAGQIMSDCYELYNVREGQDLVNGTATLPLAMHFQTLNEDSKYDFLNLLKLAQHDEEARDRVRDVVSKSGSLSQAYSFVEKCKIEAIERLQLLDPLEPAATELRSIIKRTCSST